MSFSNEAAPSVTVKKKNMLSLVEYCIENKIDFFMKSKNNDEFTLEFSLNDTKKAIALGMCLKELKMELNGMTVIPVAAIKAKKAVSSIDAGLGLGSGIVAEGDVNMAFEDALQFDLGVSN